MVEQTAEDSGGKINQFIQSRKEDRKTRKVNFLKKIS